MLSIVTNTLDTTTLGTEVDDQPAQIDDSYDVIVVGARAAGAATAMLLARRGLSVLAVAGVLQLSRWGVLDSIREAGTPAARTASNSTSTTSAAPSPLRG